MTDLKRLLYILKKYIRPYWKQLALLLTINCTAMILTAALPLIMAPILDIAMGKITPAAGVSLQNINLANLGSAVFAWLHIENFDNRFQLVIFFCVIYAVIASLKSLFDFCSYYTAQWIRVHAARDMEYDLFKHILTFSLDFFHKERTGALISRIDKDTQATTTGLEEIVRILISTPLLITFYGILLLRTSKKLALAAICAAALHYVITYFIQKPVRRHVKDQFSALANVVTKLQEAILSIRVVKSFCAEKFELKQFKAIFKNVVGINLRYGVYKHIEEPLRNTLNYFIEASILVIAAYELISGKLNAASFFLFLYVGRLIMKPISEFGMTLTAIQYTLGASSRVLELFNKQSTIKDGNRSIESFSKSIEIKDMSFSYSGTIPVLSNISLTIKKGEMVALVGPSGAGKSSLVDLVLRFYDPQRGTLGIDTVPLTELKIGEYRKLFGVVPQEALLFNASIRDNISYGRENLTDEQITTAANIANAHDFILSLPDGYDTVVGDRGIRLSGGERQRIAIARAIVTNPPIVILDEATSSLDSSSERIVQDAIDKVIKNTTAIVIAHRLSTVLRANKIVVLEQGSIVDIGKHSELLQRCPLYQKLHALQFSGSGSSSNA